MKSHSRLLSCLFALALFTGCASTKMSDETSYNDERLPRPNHIWVYDFAATPGDVPSDSALAGQYTETEQTSEQIETGRRVGAVVAKELAAEIRDMGLPGDQASGGTTPQIHDLVIRGYLVSVESGSTLKRMTIGFGSGGSELTATVEGYQVTDQGLRLLGSGTVDSGGSKTPGVGASAAVALATANPIGLIVTSGVKVYGEASGNATIEGRAKATAKEIGERLRPRFEAQGWID